MIFKNTSSDSSPRSLQLSFFFVAIIFSQNVFSQTECPKSQDKKAIKVYNEAMDNFKYKRDWTTAMILAEKALDIDPEMTDAYLLLGDIALKKHDYKTMESSYLKVIELCPDLNNETYFQLGWLEYDRKKYDDAEKYLKKFLAFDKLNEDHAKQADLMLVRAKLYAHPVPFNPEPVKGISTPDPEYLAFISPDNELAFFTRRYEMSGKNSLTPTSVEKFMWSKRTNGVFDAGEPMEPPFNARTSNNEGGPTITIDNNHLFFTVNNGGNFDIYSSDFVNGRWSELKNLGANVNDPKQWDSQPSISADGKTLYFASARDSISGIDIYKTTKAEDGNWTKAVKLSSKINTNGNEKSPFIHSDSRTFYFSSDSLPGLGGFDIFMCKLDSSGKWGTPVNLGYPINTEADEVGFFVSTDGQTGYFASNKIAGRGGFDIYSFDLYEKARPEKVLFLKGELKDEDNLPLAAKLELKNVSTKKSLEIEVDSLTGKYASVVDFKDDYILTVKREDYAFNSQYFSSRDTALAHPVTVDLSIKKISLGESYTLHNILFATNSYEINDTIKNVLDNFAEWLKENPKVKVAIQGHTDNIGNPNENLKLSENRSRTVYNYLLKDGIETARLSSRGFGETKPIANNNDEEGRAKNRRTEFVVTGK